MLKFVRIIAVFACVLLINHVEAQEPRPTNIPCKGCTYKLEVDDEHINYTLKKILAGRSDNLELVKIIKVTGQPLDGIKYKIQFEAVDKMTNDAKICDTIFYLKNKDIDMRTFNCAAK
uniref:Venom cystatin 1 n=1 Tax=Oncocephalus sp. TaxID=2944721 RepID=A0AB38ZEH7_9HEMI